MFLRNIRAPPARVPYAETILWMFRLPSCAFLYLNISRPAGCDGGARGSGACALRDVCRKAANSPRTVTSAPPRPFEKGRRKLFVQYFLQNDFFDRLKQPDFRPAVFLCINAFFPPDAVHQFVPFQRQTGIRTVGGRENIARLLHPFPEGIIMLPGSDT